MGRPGDAATVKSGNRCPEPIEKPEQGRQSHPRSRETLNPACTSTSNDSSPANASSGSPVKNGWKEKAASQTKCQFLTAVFGVQKSVGRRQVQLVRVRRALEKTFGSRESAIGRRRPVQKQGRREEHRERRRYFSK